MSMGERSCAKFGKCQVVSVHDYFCTPLCKYYLWNGKRMPDYKEAFTKTQLRVMKKKGDSENGGEK